jgi:hypothetical protein
MFLHHGDRQWQTRLMAEISHGNTELEGILGTLEDLLKYQVKSHFLHFKLPVLRARGKNNI